MFSTNGRRHPYHTHHVGENSCLPNVKTARKSTCGTIQWRIYVLYVWLYSDNADGRQLKNVSEYIILIHSRRGGSRTSCRGEDFKFNIVIFKRRTANNLELPRVKHLCCSYVESKHLENKDAINGALSPLSWTRLFQMERRWVF